MIILENNNNNVIINGDRCTKECVEQIKKNKKWYGDVNVFFLDKKKEEKYLYRDDKFYLMYSRLRYENNYDMESCYEDEFYECCDI